MQNILKDIIGYFSFQYSHMDYSSWKGFLTVVQAGELVAGGGSLGQKYKNFLNFGFIEVGEIVLVRWTFYQKQVTFR